MRRTMLYEIQIRCNEICLYLLDVMKLGSCVKIKQGVKVVRTEDVTSASPASTEFAPEIVNIHVHQ